MAVSLRNPKKWRDDKLFLSAFKCEANSEGRLQIAFHQASAKSKPVHKFQKAVKRLINAKKMVSPGVDAPELLGNIINQETNVQQSVMNDYKDNPLLVRYYMSIFLLIGVLFFVFVYLPIQGNLNLSYQVFCNSYFRTESNHGFQLAECNNWKDNVYMRWFYFIYCIYFTCSFLQIRYGSNKLKYANILNYDLTNYVETLLIKSTPFILELKTIIEWMVTSTSLTLANWFKLEDIFMEIFVAQVAYMRRTVYQRQGYLRKALMGCGSFLGISTVLIFPMILFSGLNPIASANSVENFQFQLGIKFNNSNYFLLSKVDHNPNISSISSKLVLHSFRQWDVPFDVGNRPGGLHETAEKRRF